MLPFENMVPLSLYGARYPFLFGYRWDNTSLHFIFVGYLNKHLRSLYIAHKMHWNVNDRYREVVGNVPCM
jgi:hypothetical protein